MNINFLHCQIGEIDVELKLQFLDLRPRPCFLVDFDEVVKQQQQQQQQQQVK